MFQVVVDLDMFESFVLVEKVCSEFVIKVIGWVCCCFVGIENNNMFIGQVELLGKELSIFNVVVILLFLLDEYVDVGEDVCFWYCFVDLCCLEMINCLWFCFCVISYICNYLDGNGFMDVEIFILICVIFEGVCDYLVLSCIYEGFFFVLLQLLQFFKQLLMVLGVDCYYQIVKCFWDEDLCVDCQLEFIQVDIEVLFVDEESLMSLNEGMICFLFKDVFDVDLFSFLCMFYVEVMQCFGSDKLDFWIFLELVDVVDLVEVVDFKVFVGLVKDLKG